MVDKLDPDYVKRVMEMDQILKNAGVVTENDYKDPESWLLDSDKDPLNAQQASKEQLTEERRCHYCKRVPKDKKERYKRCGRCKRVLYCSRQCQQDDWITGHRHCCSEALGNAHKPGSVLFDDEKRIVELVCDDGKRIRLHAKDSKRYQEMVQHAQKQYHKPK